MGGLVLYVTVTDDNTAASSTTVQRHTMFDAAICCTTWGDSLAALLSERLKAWDCVIFATAVLPTVRNDSSTQHQRNCQVCYSGALCVWAGLVEGEGHRSSLPVVKTCGQDKLLSRFAYVIKRW